MIPKDIVMPKKQINIDIILDTSGLECPMPLLKTKEAMKLLKEGQVVKIISTDPSSVIDFEVYSRQTSHKLLQSWQEDSKYIYLVRK